MREFLGALIAVNGIAVAVFLLRDKTVDWKGFLAVSSIVLILAVVVANLPDITQLVIKGEKVGGVTVNIQRQVQQVETRAQEVEELAKEVRGLRQQAQLLVENANAANDKIAASEKNVSELSKGAEKTKVEAAGLAKQAEAAVQAARSVEQNVAQMRDNVRQTWRSLLESFYYSVSTRNLFPIPQPVAQEIDRHLNILATFAYPDQNERNREVARIQELVRQATQRPAPPKQ